MIYIIEDKWGFPQSNQKQYVIDSVNSPLTLGSALLTGISNNTYSRHNMCSETFETQVTVNEIYVPICIS